MGAEQTMGADLAEHRARLGLVHGREAEGDVGDGLHVDAAEAEHHDRPELRIDAAAENEFVAVVRDHWLHGYAEECLL